MIAATPLNWSTRPLRREHLFKSLLTISAALAIVFACWPVLSGQPLAQALAVLIVLLIPFRAYRRRSPAVSSNTRDQHIRRVAAGHWRVVAAGRPLDGRLQHAWHGWGWITLRVQPFGPSPAVSVTVWRANVPDADWHLLRVWTAWELAMATPETHTW